MVRVLFRAILGMLLIVILVSISASACGVQPARAQVDFFIRGHITSDLTIFSATLIGDVWVDPGVTLTIGAGGTVKVGDGFSLVVRGSLNVFGTDALPAVFTGTHLTPYPGTWYTIGFEGNLNEHFLIAHSVIEAATVGVTVNSEAPAMIEYNKIWLNKDAGIHVVTPSSNVIVGNNITNNNYGVWLDSSLGNSSVIGNAITDNNYGIYLKDSSNNTIYHNNFVDNIQQVYSTTSVNAWDNGYPFGGNYWSDYLTKYPNASEIDSSGIWNTSYAIDENNTDHYPLMTLSFIGEIKVKAFDAVTGNNKIVASPSETFTVNVSIDNASPELASYEFRLSWDATVLNCTGYSLTPPQEWNGTVIIGKDQLNRTNPDGTQSYWAKVSVNASGIRTSPDHVVNMFNFTVVGLGTTTIGFPIIAYANPLLSDYNGKPIASTGVNCAVVGQMIPEFQQFLLLPLLLTVALLAVAIYRKRLPKPKARKVIW